MKRRAPPLHDDDSRLFREAIGDVRPMAPVESLPERPRPEPYPHMRDADEAALETADFFLVVVVSDQSFKRISP